jgi:hypothetical protein
MPKTNFTKVEEALTEGIHKMNISKLLDEADALKKGKKETNPLNLRVASLRHEIKWLSKQNPAFYTEISLEKKKVRALLELKEPFSSEQTIELEKLKEKIENYKAKLTPENTETENERLIADEKKKQKNVRFNIKNKWLPLH